MYLFSRKTFLSHIVGFHSDTIFLTTFLTNRTLFRNYFCFPVWFDGKSSILNASWKWPLGVRFTISVLSIMFNFTLSSNSIPVITILTHTFLVHHMLHMFADGCVRNKWIFAAASVDTTLTPTNAAAKVFQPLSYPFLQCPFQTIHFCIGNVSNKLTVLMFI